MARTQYLVDTNAIVDYLGLKLPHSGMVFMNSVMDNEPSASVITKIEVLGYNTTAEYSVLLAEFIDDINIIELTSEVVRQTILIRKMNKIKLPDAIIAATAVVRGSVIISRNVKDFQNIKGLKAINPWER